MTAGGRNISWLRYFLIILLFSVLFVGTGYLFLHYQKAQLLRNNIEKVITARENSTLIDSCIIKLYSADNYGRLYALTANKDYLEKFASDINSVIRTINSINFSGNITNVDPEKFKQLMTQKSTKTSAYIHLRLLTDSLIKSSVKINHELSPAPPVQTAALPEKPVVKVEHRVTVDTIKNPEPKAKKLLGRIFAAFSSKKEEKPKVVIIKKDTMIYSSTISEKAVKKPAVDEVITKTNINIRINKNYYKKLNLANDKLRANERQVLMINNSLEQEMINSLRIYKNLEQAYVAKSKADLQENVSDIFSEFKKVSTINLICLISLLILVFYNIWKIFRNEQRLIDHSESAEKYALLKSKFLAGMSHEIRTPLNSVLGFSEQLSQENLPPAQKEQVVAIRYSSETILDLVNEILDFSKYETGKMNFESSPFMVKQVLEEVFTTMHIHALKKHITLVNELLIDEELCCEGDKIRLKQVLMNLLGNAIKFTVKGTVTLHTSIENKPSGLVLKVKVIDTGLGISKENLPDIFDEFSQVENAQNATSHKGTGLGLAICKKIIELQGGTISVSSTVGKGSTFKFELPLKQLDSKECVVPQAVSDEQMAELVGDKYVLLAEDNRLNVLLTVTILKKWGIKYDVAYNGQEAYDLFKLNNYDVILTDIQMPEMDGLQLTQHIRKYTADPARSNTLIIALTANVMKEDRDNYFKTGVNDIILKPFREKDLIEKIALTLQNNHTALRFVN